MSPRVSLLIAGRCRVDPSLAGATNWTYRLAGGRMGAWIGDQVAPPSAARRPVMSRYKCTLPPRRSSPSRRRESLTDASSVGLTGNRAGVIRALRTLQDNDIPLAKVNQATAPMCIDDPLQHHAASIASSTRTRRSPSASPPSNGWFRRLSV